MTKNKTRSLISTLFVGVVSIFPFLGRRLWQLWYDYLASSRRTVDLRFMNYGYDDGNQISTDLIEEKYRLQAQLYQHVINGLDVMGKEILEVGSGRGGGLDYIVQNYSPIRAVGIDISARAVELCKNDYSDSRLDFINAPADKVPVDDRSIDIVLNVESSHCYPDMKAFLMEVFRILKNDGVLTLCDMRTSSGITSLENAFEDCGFRISSKTDITENVLSALDKMSDTRINISNALPAVLKFAFRDFAGVKNSAAYNLMKDRKLIYMSYQLIKRAE